MSKKTIFIGLLLVISLNLGAKLPEIDPPKVLNKVQEILKAHAEHKELTPELIKRTLNNYCEILDPNKTYFIKEDIQECIDPNETLLRSVETAFKQGQFPIFFSIHDRMINAIKRRDDLEKQIDYNNLPTDVKPEEFKKMEWVSSEDQLLTRLKRIRALQIETASKLNEELKEKSFQRLEKHQRKYEEDYLSQDQAHRQHLVLSNLLKATASSLDTHTAYFTPGEAEQFMINVQQRLFGIGAQLRDDLNGFTVVKVIEGGPAAEEGTLKAKDRIVAVDKEPVVGMDIINAVELIRGKEGTQVRLTVIRETEKDGEKKEQELDITIVRGEVVLKESRYKVSYEPFGDGVIGYLKLFSFYQDPEFSSTEDLQEQIENLKKEHNLKGLVLDLRYNTGGMLSQAVGVTSLFIKKGVVVGIKDNTGTVQYLRDLDGKMAYDGPLIVLINKASASASEIVAQTLQDYGRALVAGDEHSYGKGSFQTFTLNASKDGIINPEGEYKVTRGRYYTVSGKTPQLLGVKADIVIPGPLTEMELGESFAKYPLENDSIKENFSDDLSDIPFTQRQRVKAIYRFDLQPRLNTYEPFINLLKQNVSYRIENNTDYQALLKELKKINAEDAEVEAGPEEQLGKNDLQLTETMNVMKDLIILLDKKDS